jgi:hypothetical protein
MEVVRVCLKAHLLTPVLDTANIQNGLFFEQILNSNKASRGVRRLVSPKNNI